MTVSPARLVAISVLHRVAQKGAFASLALDSEVKRARLDVRDAALASEIVYGSLRILPKLDDSIAAQVRRDTQKIDPFVTAVLRASCYQLQHLDRVPAHAVVNDAVTLVTHKRGRVLAAFVNAVLRKIASQPHPLDKTGSKICLPEWLQPLLLEALGQERFHFLVEGRRVPPPLGLRVNLARVGREQLAEKITRAVPRAEIALGELSPWALVLRGAGDPRSLPGYLAGEFFVQEEGAQLVVLSLGCQPGEKIVDACAGHGGKTWFLAQLVGAAGAVTALDVDQRKLDAIARDRDRLGMMENCGAIESLAVDLTVGTGSLRGVYDRVLVDAPCSGLGTIDRRPELLLRLSPADLDRIARLQIAILVRASKLVRQGGRLVYAVCSPLRQEGTDVVSAFEAREPNFRRLMPSPCPGLPLADSDGITRIGPWLGPKSVSSVDAFQIIQWIAA
jgi:16S rRNA (cytosine967-C5)-methyltransferase